MTTFPATETAHRIETAIQGLSDAQWAIGYLSSAAALSPEWTLELTKMAARLSQMTAGLVSLEAEQVGGEVNRAF